MYAPAVFDLGESPLLQSETKRSHSWSPSAASSGKDASATEGVDLLVLVLLRVDEEWAANITG